MLTRRLLELTLPKRAKVCYGCEGEFAAGDPVYSLIREGEEEGFLREDRCVACWEQALEADEGVLSLWQGEIPPEKRGKPKEMALSGKERALKLLRAYLDAGEMARAFLLALYLERRDVLVRCKQLKRKSGRVRLYEVAETGEALYVPRQELIPEQNRMQEELLQALRGEEDVS